MRVLIISLAYTPFVGGAELAVKEITDRMPEHTFDLLTVNLDGKQQDVQRIGDVTVYRLGKGMIGKYTFPFTAAKKAEALQREHKYDVVWAIMANQAGLAALWFKKKNPDVKFLLTLQEGDSLKRIWSRTFFMRGMYKMIYKKADAIQAISNFLATRAKRMGFAKEISIVPNGVDLEHFNAQYSDEEKNSLKQKLGIGSEEKIVVTTSRLVHKNALDTLIAAMKDVDAKLLIIGSGHLEAKLKSQTQELQIRDKVLFLGHIPHAQLGPYLAISDVFVRPSRSEGLGSSFLEAMAVDLPVIATPVGGIPDFLKDGETGLFCEVDNPKNLAQKINTLLTNDELRNSIIQKGSAMVHEKYTWDSVTRDMKKVFQEL